MENLLMSALTISKEDEKYVKYIEIDYIDDWSGADFVITAGF